jgi:hypothetical protein
MDDASSLADNVASTPRGPSAASASASASASAAASASSAQPEAPLGTPADERAGQDAEFRDELWTEFQACEDQCDIATQMMELMVTEQLRRIPDSLFDVMEFLDVIRPRLLKLTQVGSVLGPCVLWWKEVGVTVSA